MRKMAIKESMMSRGEKQQMKKLLENFKTT